MELDEQLIRNELKERCKARGTATQIASDLGLSISTVTRWAKGGEISQSNLQILQMYFFKAMPKNLGKQQLDSILSFTLEEWRMVEDQAQQAGLSPSDWIREQVRTIIAVHDSLKARAKPEAANIVEMAADDPVPHKTGLTAPPDPTKMFELPFLGAVAAGEQVIAPRTNETVPVPKEYPEGYFVVEVNGQSMEPTLIDGDRIVCMPKEYTPGNNKICVISDGFGSSIKRFDRKKMAFVSDNPDYPDFIPADEVKYQGEFVEVLAE